MAASPPRCVVFLACALSLACPEVLLAKPGPNTMEKYIKCGTPDDDPLSVYQENVAFVLMDLVYKTAHNNNDRYSRRGTGQDTCYGHATCFQGLAAQFCVDCLEVAQKKSIAKCGFTRSVDTELRDCSLAYQDEPF